MDNIFNWWCLQRSNKQKTIKVIIIPYDDTSSLPNDDIGRRRPFSGISKWYFCWWLMSMFHWCSTDNNTIIKRFLNRTAVIWRQQVCLSINQLAHHRSSTRQSDLGNTCGYRQPSLSPAVVIASGRYRNTEGLAAPQRIARCSIHRNNQSWSLRLLLAGQ